MKNVTITLDEAVARWARVKAAEHDKSLSRFLADLLEQQMLHEPDQRAEFLETFRSVKPVQLRKPGEALPTRDELYDRKVLRRQ
jgi:plasmid stability protein